MKKILSFAAAAAACLLLTRCAGDFLSVSSPAQTDDPFVTSTVDETFKTLSWCYGKYRSGIAGGGNYNWNDPCTDVEYYPEYNSGNGRVGALHPELTPVDERKSQFDALYAVLARCDRISKLIAEKEEYSSAVEAGTTNDWTQLYGECRTFWAYCYYELVRHYGDVPFGIENSTADEYGLTSRFKILDECIAELQRVEPLMYDLGQGGITAERMSRTFNNLLIGEIALNAGGYQTIRTDVEGLYGDVAFENMYTGDGCSFSRRTDWEEYYRTAQTWLRKVLNERKGSSYLLTSDDRGYADNPFQRGFQYMHDKEISPESIWEVGNIAPNQTERPYSQGRPSEGGNSNGAPCKVFSGIRVTPTFYYAGYEDGDGRWDASAVVTGSDGKGNEMLVNLGQGSRCSGGIAINKWDINKMKEPYTAAPRKSGLNYVMRRVSNAMLLLAEADAQLGESAEALQLLNDLRARAFGDNEHQLAGLSGEELVEAVTMEVKRELLGEGDVKWNEIRNGTFTEKAKAVRAEIQKVIDGLETDGHYDFGNGRTISNYVWTKLVYRENTLTYDRDESDPALTPGWRGVYDFSSTSVASVVEGTDHNLAIEGLFEYIDPEGAEAQALEAEGYTRTDWGVKMVEQRDQLWDYNILSGIENSDVPLYFHPIPLETIQQSGGGVSNGYGLPQQ